MICALGLNIVVGYAGLLDLGYVAFWAIGGYVAGWLMSGLRLSRTSSFHFFGASAPTRRPGIHITSGCVLIVAGVVLRSVGHPHRRPDAAAEERLPRPGHARLRRDHPAGLPQRRQHRRARTSPTAPRASPRSTRSQGFSSTTPASLGASSARSTYACKFVVFCAARRVRASSSRCGCATAGSGRAWLAIREDELAASMMGVPLMRTKLAAYARRRGRRRARRRRVRRARRRASSPDRFDFSISIIAAGDGRARRHGQRLGRHRRRAGAGLGQLHRA